jgi:hypothetical protein
MDAPDFQRARSPEAKQHREDTILAADGARSLRDRTARTQDAQGMLGSECLRAHLDRQGGAAAAKGATGTVDLAEEDHDVVWVRSCRV